MADTLLLREVIAQDPLSKGYGERTSAFDTVADSLNGSGDLPWRTDRKHIQDRLRFLMDLRRVAVRAAAVATGADDEPHGEVEQLLDGLLETTDARNEQDNRLRAAQTRRDESLEAAGRDARQRAMSRMHSRKAGTGSVQPPGPSPAGLPDEDVTLVHDVDSGYVIENDGSPGIDVDSQTGAGRPRSKRRRMDSSDAESSAVAALQEETRTYRNAQEERARTSREAFELAQRAEQRASATDERKLALETRRLELAEQSQAQRLKLEESRLELERARLDREKDQATLMLKMTSMLHDLATRSQK